MSEIKTDIAAQLARNEKRLSEAWGDSIPALSPEVLEQASRAVEQLGGRMPGNGRDATTPGRRSLAGLPGRARAGGQAGSGLPGWTQGIPAHWLPALASAYRQRREEQYARAAKAYYEYFLELEPVEKGWHPPDNYDILIIPHRLGDTECVGWFGALPEFLESELFDEKLLKRIVESARIQLNHLAGHVHEGRNMRMTQADALLTEGLRLAFLSDSARWRAVGLHALNDAFFRQFHPDGGSVEATGWYHFIVMNMALRFWRLLRTMPVLGLQVTAEQVGAAFDYLLALVQPDGKLNRIGDCTAHLTPNLRTLAAVLEQRAAVRRELSLPEAELPLSQSFPYVKQAMLRDGWGSEATYLTFDATTRVGYHWHPARNAIQLYFSGSRVIADPGRMAFAPVPQRCYAGSTRGHSTMNLNAWNQSSAEASLRIRSLEGYDFVDSLYEGGYWPGSLDDYRTGMFGGHHRILFWVRGRFILVLDNLSHTAREGEKPTVESNWQFAPGLAKLSTTADGKPCVLTQHGAAHMLMLFQLMPSAMSLTLHEGETEPVARGWIADDADKPVAAPMLRLAIEKFDPWNIDMATLLIPYKESTAPEVTTTQSIDPANAGYGKIVFRFSGGSTDEIYWKRRLCFALDGVDGLLTDSAFVHLQKRANGDLLKAFIFEGSFLAPYMSRWLPERATFVIGPEGKVISSTRKGLTTEAQRPGTKEIA